MRLRRIEKPKGPRAPRNKKRVRQAAAAVRALKQYEAEQQREHQRRTSEAWVSSSPHPGSARQAETSPPATAASRSSKDASSNPCCWNTSASTPSSAWPPCHPTGRETTSPSQASLPGAEPRWSPNTASGRRSPATCRTRTALIWIPTRHATEHPRRGVAPRCRPARRTAVDAIGTVRRREALDDLCHLLGSTVTGYCRAGQPGPRAVGSWPAGWLDCGRSGCPGVGKR